MASYISSNSNRFYAVVETSYGQAAAITASNRFPAVRLQAHQSLVRGKRQDKTGSRTYLGASSSARRATAFEVKTYLTSWSGTGEPSYGPFFHAALGASGVLSSGLVVASTPNATTIQTQAPHGLAVGNALSYAGEIRFVTSVPDSKTVVLNATLSTTPAAGSALAPAITYSLATALPSVSVYDYWDPITAVSRVITGGGVDTLGGRRKWRLS